MADRYKLQEVSSLKGNGIFFDANILIYLFWPTGSNDYEENYARVFRALLQQNNPLYVNFWVVSEVINRVIRIEHKKLKPDGSYKTFRNSEAGKSALEDINLIVANNILTQFNLVSKDYSLSDITSFLTIDELDFMDKATVSICQTYNLVLLTNDTDFRNENIKILTGHPKLLK